MENLRYMLSNLNTSDPIYLGYRYRLSRRKLKLNFMAGGPGYVLSKEALNRFVNRGLLNEALCKDYEAVEDLMVGKCLKQVGVTIQDSRDSFAKERFFVFHSEVQLIPSKIPNWYWPYQYYKTDEVNFLI